MIHKINISQSAADPCLWWTSHEAIQEDLSGQSFRSRQLSVLKISTKSVPPGDLRLEYSKLAFFCLQISFSQTVSKMKSIPNGVIFAFPRVRKSTGFFVSQIFFRATTFRIKTGIIA